MSTTKASEIRTTKSTVIVPQQSSEHPPLTVVRSRSVVLRTVTLEELARSSMFIRHPTSYIETLMNMIRIYLGTGMFAMSYAFKNTGLILGSVLTVIFMIAATYCNHVLVNSAEEIKFRREVMLSLDMPDIVYYSLLYGPNCCACCANFMRKLIEVTIILLQLSVCTVYIVFTAASLKVISESFGDISMDVRIYIMIVTIPILATSLIRELKYLAPLSFMGNLLAGLGTTIVYFIISQDLPDISSRKFIVDYHSYPIFLGTFFFSVSGVGMTMPLRNEMQDPKQFSVWYGVLNTSMFLNGCLLLSIGFLGYLKYGDDVEGSVTLNLPVDNWASVIVQAAIALSVMLSYAINFYLANSMIWREINRRVGIIDSAIVEGLMTCFLVSTTMLVAICLPHLGAVISLTGALSTSMLLLFYPQLCDIILRWTTTYGILCWRLFLNIFLMILAFVAMITGVQQSILLFLGDK